jgi:hypothetical protein
MPVSAVARATAHCWLLAAVGPTCSGGVSMVSMVYRRKHRMGWRGVALARAGVDGMLGLGYGWLGCHPVRTCVSHCHVLALLCWF